MYQTFLATMAALMLLVLVLFGALYGWVGVVLAVVLLVSATLFLIGLEELKPHGA
jgi:hypothetical protein